MRRELDNSLLEMALVGYQAKRDEVVQKMADIERQLGAASAPVVERTDEGKPKRRISAAGRRAIAEAQRKRWAASRKTAESPKTPEAPKAKRRLSKAGRAAIMAATKKRWALKRAEAAKAMSQRTAKSAPAKAAKKAAAVVAVRKAAPRTASVKSVKKTARKSAPGATRSIAPVRASTAADLTH
jgi:6-phosphogluconate dehydrogenase